MAQNCKMILLDSRRSSTSPFPNQNHTKHQWNTHSHALKIISPELVHGIAAEVFMHVASPIKFSNGEKRIGVTRIMIIVIGARKIWVLTIGRRIMINEIWVVRFLVPWRRQRDGGYTSPSHTCHRLLPFNSIFIFLHPPGLFAHSLAPFHVELRECKYFFATEHLLDKLESGCPLDTFSSGRPDLLLELTRNSCEMLHKSESCL